VVVLVGAGLPQRGQTLALEAALAMVGRGSPEVRAMALAGVGDDVAQAFERTLANWNAAVGESFHVVSPAALTLRGFAEAVAGWFGRTAHLRFVPWEDGRKGVSEEGAAATWDHIAHSPNCIIDKARRSLGYWPRYSSFQAVGEALDWMTEHEVIDAG
jgi:nucleoside-diphosphate-sugar epimerase